jgi:hypothetical protein
VSGSRAPVHRQQPARDRAVTSSSRRARCSHLRRYDFSGSSFCAPTCPYLWEAAIGLEGPEFPGMITEPLGRSGHGRPPEQQERLFVIIWRAGGPVRTSDVPGYFLLSLPCLVRDPPLRPEGRVLPAPQAWLATAVRLYPARLFVHARQCRAALPEQQSSSVVPGPRRRRNRCGSVKVLPRHPGNFWRGGEIDHRFCAVSR